MVDDGAPTHGPVRPRTDAGGSHDRRDAASAGVPVVRLRRRGLPRPRQSLSPVHPLPPEAIPNDPVPGERYYILVFGSETGRPGAAVHAHLGHGRQDRGGPGLRQQVAEVHTISWMPATLDIRPWRFTPEPGRNLELHETIRMALGFREHVALWGPYEVQPQLYRRFLLQKAFMESGRVGYQCIDTVGEGADGSGCDCIHAVTDMDPQFDRDYYRLTRFGEAGSQFIVRQLFERDLSSAGRRTPGSTARSGCVTTRSTTANTATGRTCSVTGAVPKPVARVDPVDRELAGLGERGRIGLTAAP